MSRVNATFLVFWLSSKTVKKQQKKGRFLECSLNLILLEGFVDFSIGLYALYNLVLKVFSWLVDQNEKPA